MLYTYTCYENRNNNLLLKKEELDTTYAKLDDLKERIKQQEFDIR